MGLLKSKLAILFILIVFLMTIFIEGHERPEVINKTTEINCILIMAEEIDKWEIYPGMAKEFVKVFGSFLPGSEHDDNVIHPCLWNFNRLIIG